MNIPSTSEAAPQPAPERIPAAGAPAPAPAATGPAPQPAPRPTAAPKKDRRPLYRGLLITGGALLLVTCAGLVFVAAQGGWYRPLPVTEAAPVQSEQQQATTVRRLANLAPRGIYVVVDTYANRLRVYRGGDLLHEALCSTGSGTILRDPETGREWVFDTPLGERRVERKQRDPVWIKPDWAFIEEGYKPPENGRQRVDDLSLGEYGLYLGDGYIIHGTLFQTLLGRRITHGCIRLGDKDLEYVYHQVPLGARVYLY